MTQSALERNPALRIDTPLIPTPPPPPPVSVITGFDCLDIQDLGGGGRVGPRQSCPLTFKFVPTGLSQAVQCC